MHKKGASEAPRTHFRACKTSKFSLGVCPQTPSHNHGPRFLYLPWAPPILSAALQSHIWQPLSMCRQNSVRGRPENSLHQEKTHGERIFRGRIFRGSFLMERIFRSTPNGVLTAHTEWLPDVRLVVVRLSWLSGRALAAQARGVLGSTPGDCRLFHFPLFRLITSKFNIKYSRKSHI